MPDPLDPAGLGLLASEGANRLDVTFGAAGDVTEDGRFMACTGGWDWAPYSTTATAQADPTFSRGILRDVYLVPVRTGGAALEVLV